MKTRKGFLKEVQFNLIFWIIACNLFDVYRYVGIYDYFTPKVPIKIGVMFAVANIIAVVCGFLLSIVDYSLDNRDFKRKSFRQIMIVKSLSYSIMICIGIISIFVIHGIVIGRENILLSSLQYALTTQYSIAIFVYGVFMSLLLNFIKQVNKKFGPGVLWKLFSGKYHEPRQENRIFMFLDLKSSTSIAEKLGHFKYSQFIQECFYDITTIISDFKAEIYQYVGDEIVLTWDIEKGIEDENCFHFFFAFKELLCDRKDNYLKKFGLTPEFKAGMNCGYVTVAEVGEIKKDIAYHGDVLNIAARIQNQCNNYYKDILISHALHKLMPRFEGFRGELIGEVLLKGKHESTGLYSLEMAV